MTESYRGKVPGTTKEGFTCALCGRWFPYEDDWEEALAIAEVRAAGEDWAGPENLVAVCDDCYKNPLSPWNAERN